MDYAYYERLIDKGAVGRYDVTPIFADAEAFARLIEDLAGPFADARIDLVVGLEAIGFALAAAVAARLHAGFAPIRKDARLPLTAERKRSVSFVDYTGREKSFEMRADAIREGSRVIVVDDWIETGAQLRAAAQLIEGAGGILIGASVLAAERTAQTNELFERYDVRAIGVFDKR